MRQLGISFNWPALPDSSFREEFFLGAWHPSANLKVHVDSCRVPNHWICSVEGMNWFLMSSTSPFNDMTTGLVRVLSSRKMSTEGQINEAVAFRGYILEPPIHSWSRSEDIIDFWRKDHDQYNGVFSAALIGRDGKQLKLITDAFGIAALYYREFDNIIFFSTNSRFLAMQGDRLDTLAGRILIQCGSVYGNRTLTQSVLRVPPGTSITFDKVGVLERKWFSFSDLPSGERHVSPTALKEVEAAFQTSIDRCLRLQATGCVLPLSSGYDSRRILAALRSRGVGFKALTVRTIHKSGLDLDAYWASKMAKELGFDHEVVDLPFAKELTQLDKLRRLLMDSHNLEHTWFLSLHALLPHKSCLIFDGLGGDVFNNTGFGVKQYLELEPQSALEKMLAELITETFDHVLAKGFWPSLKATRNDLQDFLRGLPQNRNTTDLAFILTRTRSGPGMCSQRLLPTGHVVVYPYLDLDYACITLSFNPAEKMPPETLQARCLAEFCPEYYAFPGTRRLPHGVYPAYSGLAFQRQLICFEKLRGELNYQSWLRLMRALAPRAYFLALGSNYNQTLSQRIRWWLEPLLMLILKQQHTSSCWRRVT